MLLGRSQSTQASSSAGRGVRSFQHEEERTCILGNLHTERIDSIVALKRRLIGHGDPFFYRQYFTAIGGKPRLTASWPTASFCKLDSKKRVLDHQDAFDGATYTIFRGSLPRRRRRLRLRPCFRPQALPSCMCCNPRSGSSHRRPSCKPDGHPPCLSDSPSAKSLSRYPEPDCAP